MESERRHAFTTTFPINPLRSHSRVLSLLAMPSLSLSSVLFLVVQLQVVVLVLSYRVKRAAYQLPAGTMEQTGLTEIKMTFKCEKDGYYADVDNECKLYHICNGRRHDTLACGANQRFDQSKFVCNREDDAIPCEASEDFHYLNERIGMKDQPFLTPADIDRARNARPDLKARARRKARKVGNIRKTRKAEKSGKSGKSKKSGKSRKAKKTKSPKKSANKAKKG